MVVIVRWPSGEHLVPEVRLGLDFGEFDDVRADVDLARAYAVHDRGLGAATDDVLTPTQHATLVAVRRAWKEVSGVLSAHFPRGLRAHLRWTGFLLTDQVRDGHVYVELTGYVDATDHAYEEHGIGAFLLGATVVGAGERGLVVPRPREPARPAVPLRPHPDHRALDRREVERMVASDDWRGLLRRNDETDHASAALVDEVVLRRILNGTAEQARRLPRGVAGLLLRGEPLPARLLDGDPEIVRLLVAIGRYRIPRGALADAADAGQIRRWVRVGASPNGEGGAEPPLRVHAADPERFAALLELGADPAVLRDEWGELLVPLREAQRAALQALHPGFLDGDRAPAPPPDPGALARWQELGWIRLTDGASEALVALALDTLLRTAPDPATFVELLAKVQGIDEIFVTDEELAPLLQA